MQKPGESNSGSLDALIDFIKWGIKNYPAERYALILWNHGGGWADEDIYADRRMRSIHRAARGRIRHSFFLSNLNKAVEKRSLRAQTPGHSL